MEEHTVSNNNMHRVFLHISEYPPDANQGPNIPSAAISFPNFHATMFFPSNVSVRKPPLLSKFQERNHAFSYTKALPVPLTTPDFSMPTISSQSLARCCKIRSPSELLSRFSAKLSDSSPLMNSKSDLKVLLVAAFAVVWQY
ncbi:PREDICTED: uncharacterized protein LOC105125857 [Populus euphratica]|uniref:Uncharacterized protein LOC105125857 n=1 Tax=Populus euphratica TaxID=75702 RepID=A0AAJ6XN54_POPEU|nr:PREDICTED: uncharacterized protein LOC105125857 [Populus euphratica]